MTIPEQTGKIVTSVTDGLKTNPSCLAAIVLAAFFALLTYIALQREAERSQLRLQSTIDLLNKCIDVGKEPRL